MAKQVTDTTPAADVRQFIEDVQARHYQFPALAEALGRAEPNSCVTCSQKWPCDAARLADKLEQAVTALEFYGDEGKWGDDGPIGTRLDYGWIAHAALWRMAGGE